MERKDIIALYMGKIGLAALFKERAVGCKILGVGIDRERRRAAFDGKIGKVFFDDLFHGFIVNALGQPVLFGSFCCRLVRVVQVVPGKIFSWCSASLYASPCKHIERIDYGKRSIVVSKTYQR